MNKGVVFMGMGFELVGLVIGAIIFGGIVEEYFVWPKGYATVALIVLLTIGWFWHLIVLLKKYMENTQDEQNNKDRNNSPRQ